MGTIESALRAQSLGGGGLFRSKPVIAFIGTGLDFPNTSLDIVRDELDGVAVARFESLRELEAAGKAKDYRVHVLVIPESRLADLIERKEVYESAAGNGRMVLAYETLEAAELLCREDLAFRVSFMPMHCPVDVWTAFVRLICFGQDVIPADLFKTALSGKDRSEAPVGITRSGHHLGNANLTAREAQILELVAQGLKNKEIGARLGLSEHTVKLHLHNTFAKLGVPNRASAAAYYLNATGHDGA